MGTAESVDDLRRLSLDLVKHELAGNREFVEPRLAEAFRLRREDGSVFDRTEFLERIAPNAARSCNERSLQVRLLGDRWSSVTYRIEEEATASGEEPKSFPVACLYVLDEAGKWRLLSCADEKFELAGPAKRAARKTPEPMSTFLRRCLRVTLFVGGLLGAACMAVAWWIAVSRPPTERIADLKLLADVFKTIVAGTGAALLAVLIPATLTAEKARFVRRRASRREFSRTQTATYYLALEMSTLPLGEATRVLQRAHVHKHMAELYGDLGDWLALRGESTKTPGQWAEEKFDAFEALGNVLREHATTWDRLPVGARLARLVAAQDAAKAPVPHASAK